MNREWIELWLHRGDDAEPEPLRVGYSPGATAAEVIRALASHVGQSDHADHIDASLGTECSLVGVDPAIGVIDPEAALPHGGPRRGQVVRIYCATEPSQGTVAPTMVAVRRGPDRGHRVPLGESLVVGRAPGCDLVLADPAVSRRHLRLTRRRALVEIEPLGESVIGLDGRRLRTSMPVEPGNPIRLGDSELVIVAPTRPTADAPGSHQRPPRAPWCPNPPSLDIAEPPRRTGVGTVPWLSIGLTAAFAIVMMSGGGFGGGMAGNMIWFFTPLLLASGATEYAWSARRTDRKARAAWRTDLTHRCRALAAALEMERRREAHAFPPLSDWALAAQSGSARLWERRREHSDALRLRLGLVQGRAAVTGELASVGPADLLAEASNAVERVRWRHDLVSALNLAEVGSLGIHGPDAHLLAASLVAQLVAAVGPEDVALAVAVTEGHAPGWRWAAALPHLRSAAELLDGPSTAGARNHDQLTASLAALGAARRRRCDETDGERRQAEVPIVVVLDGELGSQLELRRLAALCRFGDVGIHVMWLGRRPSRTPLGCGATVTTSRPGRATVVAAPGEVPQQVRWEHLDHRVLDRLTRHLAPRRDGDRTGTGAGLPAAVSLASIPGRIPEPGGLDAIIGVGPDGPTRVDLRRDGPHALVAGTTGAGKSELLRTLVAGLAMAHSPQRLNFVLVDFKGGTGMGPLARLPHVAGMITDLDVDEAQRLRLGLEAEVDRRLRLLHGAGVENLAAMERHDPVGAPPAIVVVIDEFAALARRAPTVLDALVDLAQRGRSLGIHLVLATQRPRGVISDAIRANTNLRLVARMADAEESIDVLDNPAAARLAVGIPGRVLMRVGAATPTVVQVAFTGTTVGERPPVTVEPLTLDRPSPGPTVAPSAGGRTEAEAVVASTRMAAGHDGVARRLWLEPLPPLLDRAAWAALVDQRPDVQADHLTRRDPPHPMTGTTTPGWPIAVADLPRRRQRGLWTIDPTGGVLVVLGGGGSGRTSALRALAMTAARNGAAVTGLDGGGSLARLDGATVGTDPQVSLGAIVPVRDDERMARLLWWLETDPAMTPRVLIIDGWEGIWDRADQAGTSSWFARLVELVRTARGRGLTAAISADRAGALPPEVRSSRTEVLALAGAEAEPDLGLDRPPAAGQPPGRARLVTAQPHLLGGESDPTEGPLVQLRWMAPDIDPGPARPVRRDHPDAAPLLSTYPARLRSWDRSVAEHAPHETGVCFGIDLERDAPVGTPPHGPFWVLGRPRSGRSTALEALRAFRPAGTVGLSVLIRPGRSIGQPGAWDRVLGAPPDAEGGFGTAEPVAMMAIDDAHRLDDDHWASLDRWLATLNEQCHAPLVAVAADPASLDRWNPVVTSLLGHGAGLMLAPEPDEDGRLLGGDLPRYRPFSMRAGRGYLLKRGQAPRAVQVGWPDL